MMGARHFTDTDAIVFDGGGTRHAQNGETGDQRQRAAQLEQQLMLKKSAFCFHVCLVAEIDRGKLRSTSNVPHARSHDSKSHAIQLKIKTKHQAPLSNNRDRSSTNEVLLLDPDQ
jgi:hypothetical protein